MDAVLLIALLFKVSSPANKSTIPQAGIEGSAPQISPFTLFTKNLERLFSKYGSWDNVPPVELTALRDQVRLRLERQGIHINRGSGISGPLDQLLPSCYRTFSMAKIDRCSHCGNCEDVREPVQKDTLHIHVLRYLAASGLSRLGLQSMIDYRVKVRNSRFTLTCHVC